MISLLLNIILVFLGIYFFEKSKKDKFCIVFFLILSSGINLIPVFGMSPVDWAVFLCLMILVLNNVRPSIKIRLKDDPLGKSILCMVLFVLVRASVGYFLNEDSLGHVLLSTRPILFWLTYFLFKEIPLSSFEKAMHEISILSLVSCILVFSQFFGLSIGNYSAKSFGSRLYCLVGFDFVLFWSFLNIKKNIIYAITAALITVFFIVGGGRFHLVLLLVFLLGLFTMKLKTKGVKILFVLLASVVLVFALIMNSNSFGDFGRFSQMKNDIERVSELQYSSAVKGNYLESGNSATMLFRLTLAKERWMYLITRPQSLLFGIGPIYDSEKNQNNKFNFYLGTSRVDSKGIYQIETVDISFVTHLFRYGIFGLILLFIVLFNLVKVLFQGRNIFPVEKTAFYVMLLYLLQCVGANYFDRYQFMGFILIAAGGCYNETRKKMWHSDS